MGHLEVAGDDLNDGFLESAPHPGQVLAQHVRPVLRPRLEPLHLTLEQHHSLVLGRNLPVPLCDFKD